MLTELVSWILQITKLGILRILLVILELNMSVSWQLSCHGLEDTVTYDCRGCGDCRNTYLASGQRLDVVMRCLEEIPPGPGGTVGW
jgi:hypothetical protein